jgi:hypothetical protein
MRKTIVLLYSGGVDSIMCLKHLVDKGITPFLFHFKVKKFKLKHEKMIRKSAKLLSPNSPFYVFETETEGFVATYGMRKRKAYYVIHIQKEKEFNPFECADKIVVGYHRYRGRHHKHGFQIFPEGQKEFIEWAKCHKLRLMFPLEDYTPAKIEKEFRKLPLIIRRLAISTTRGYFKGVFLPTEKKDIEVCNNATSRSS